MKILHELSENCNPITTGTHSLGAPKPPSSSALDKALALAARGFRVCPLKPGSKLPYTRDDRQPKLSGGPYKATSDANVIRDWFDIEPDLNIGIVACEVDPGSNVFLNVIDLDLQKDKARALKQYFAVLLNALGKTYQEATAQTTPNGGNHIFMLTRGFRLDNAQDHNGMTGLDVRGAQGSMPGGYVVADGSTVVRHDGSKGGYILTMGQAGTVADIPELTREAAEKLKLPIFGAAPNPSSPSNRKKVAKPPPRGTQPTTVAPLVSPQDETTSPERLEAILDLVAHHIPDLFTSYDGWAKELVLAVGGLVKRGGINADIAADILISASEKYGTDAAGNNTFDQAAIDKILDEFGHADGSKSIGGLIRKLKDAGVEVPGEPAVYTLGTTAPGQPTFNLTRNEELEVMRKGFKTKEELAAIVAHTPLVRSGRLRVDRATHDVRIYLDGIWQAVAAPQCMGISPAMCQLLSDLHHETRDMLDLVCRVERQWASHYIARRITQLRIGQEAATGAPHLTSEEAAALEMKLGMACLSGKPGAVVRLGEHQRERLQFFGQHGLKGVWDLLKDRPELLTDFCTGKVDGHRAIVVAPDCVMLDNGNLAPHDPRYLATRRTAFMLGAALAPAGALDKPGGWCPRQVPKPLPTDPIAQLGEIFGCPRAVKLIADQCKDDFATVRRVITTLGAAYRGDNLGKVGCIVAMGPTGCGKSQPIDMMEVVFGEDDAGIIESSVLSGAKSNGDPELIQICSRLFAGCHEWQSYRDSDFGRMKLMVEGKPLPLRDNHARASDGKRFEYRFGGVLYLATNNPPRVPEDVGALVERCLVLCPDQIAPDLRTNDKLGEKIAIEEGPAIIRMLVMMGARHKRNDPVPARVIINRKKLFTAMSGPTITEDVQDWIAARCTVGRGLTITASDALRSFQDWFRLTMGEEAKTGSKGLKKELEGLGYPASRTKTSRFFAGLALTAQPQNGAASRPQMSPLVPAAPQPAALVKPVIPPASSPTPPAVAGAAQPGSAALSP